MRVLPCGTDWIIRSLMGSDLHDSCVVIDSHCDALGMDILAGSGLDLSSRPGGHFDIDRAMAGGVSCVFLACCESDGGPAFARKCIRALEGAMAGLVPVLSSRGIRAGRAAGRLGVLLHIEGAGMLGDPVYGLRGFHDRGVRSVGLVHKKKNDVAESVSDCPDGTGLSDAGIEMIAEMNRLGMIIDVAHLSAPGLEHLLDITMAPVISSHTGCRALCDHDRNLTDPQIAAVAKGGGVVCMSFVPFFLASQREDASLATLVEHVQHAASVGGIDCVGIGSDFDGFTGPEPDGLEDASCYGRITDALSAAGMSDDDCRKVMGGNMFRIIETVLG